MSNNLFHGTSGPPDARIAIVGESYGFSERMKQKPFVGKSGQELDAILAECKISRADVFCTNVINEQPPSNDMWRFFHPTVEARKQNKPLIRGLYPCNNVIASLDILRQQLQTVQPEIIIGLGNYTLWALTEASFNIDDKEKRKIPTGIGQWRGSQLYTRDEHIPFMPTFHPAAIFRNWPYRYAIKNDLARRIPKVFQENGNGWREPKYNIIIRPSVKQVMDYLICIIAYLKNPNIESIDLSVDLETRGGHIACCGIGFPSAGIRLIGPNFLYDAQYFAKWWAIAQAISIPFMCAENPEGYFTLDEEVLIIGNLSYILTHPKIRLIGQNFLFDAQYFAKWWAITVNCAFDTMLMHHVCWPGTPMGLGYLSSLYCEHHMNWKAEGDIGEDKEWGTDVPEEQLWTYNCKDVIKTAEIKYVLVKLIKQLGLEEQAATQMAQFDMLLDVQLRGSKIDTKVRAKTSFDLMGAIDERVVWLDYIIPEDVLPRKPKAKHWTGSPQQQAELFYDILGIPTAGSRSVNDENLERIGRIEPILWPITSCLQELRSLRVFNNNFCKARLDFGDRLRCSYNPTAKTFRYKSSRNAFGTGTNLQNIPEGTAE